MLRLSQASANLLHPHSPHAATGKGMVGPKVQDGHLDVTTIAFLRVLEETKHCIMDIPSAWSPHRERESENDILEPLSAHTIGRDFNSAIYWLYMRLGMFRLSCTTS